MKTKTKTEKPKKSKPQTTEPLDAALEQANAIAEATLTARAAKETRILEERIAEADAGPTVRRIPVIKPDSPTNVATLEAAERSGVLAGGSGKTRAFCRICAEHFGTQSRHWTVSRILSRHAKRPYTDPAFLAWLTRHAEIEGLAFPKAS